MLKRQNKTMESDDDIEQVSTRGRPVGDREAKRKELLHAASTVIAQEGYANASLRKVAKHAGYTTGAVTYYFANKEELVVALMESAFDRFDAMLESARESGDILAPFESWIRLTDRSTRFWPATSELLAQGRHEPAFAEVISRRYARYRRLLAAIVKDAQERGAVRNDIPADILTDQLVAMGDGWMMMYPIEPKRFTPKRMRALIDALAVLVAPVPGEQKSGGRAARA